MKPVCRYQMDFNGKWTRWSLLSMALSFFLFMVYTFGVSNLVDAGFFKAVFVMLLPTALTAGYVVLLKIKEMNAPGIYALIGAVICICAMIGNFFSGNVLRIIFSIIWYPVCAVGILACVGGYLPSVTPACAVIGVAAFVRFLFFLGAGFSLENLVAECAFICGFVSLAFLPLGLKQGRMKD